MIEFWSSGVSKGSRIDNKLNALSLSSKKVQQERVAVVDFEVNERSSNTTSSTAINHIVSTPI